MHFRSDMFTKTVRNLAYFTATLTVTLPNLMATAQAQSGPTANEPYTVSVFATAPAGLTNPDDITVADGDIFIGSKTSPSRMARKARAQLFSTAGPAT